MKSNSIAASLLLAAALTGCSDQNKDARGNVGQNQAAETSDSAATPSAVPDSSSLPEIESALDTFQSGQPAKALGIIDPVIDAKPQDATARMVRATMLRKMGEYEKAIHDLDIVIQNRDDLANAYCQRAFCLFQQSRDGWQVQAARDAARSIELDDTGSLAHIILGQAYWASDELEKARDCFTAATTRNPSSFSALGNRAAVNIELGNKSEASKDIRKAL